MAKNAVYDYSTTAASNTDIDALDATGATGLVKSGDNYTRSLMSHLKAKANDDGAVNTVGGTGDAITVTLASNPTALVDGMRFSINAPGTNTGAVTIAVSNSGATLLGTKKVRKWSGGAETALSAGDITSGHILNLVYDSARDTAAGAFMIDGGASVAAATTSVAGIVEQQFNTLYNIGLACSVGSSALTIALKDADGNDPSSSSPVVIPFRNVTAATGTPSPLAVTAATSLVISSGSTLGAPTGSIPFKIWVVGFNDGGTFRLGAILCTTLASGILTSYPLSAHGIASSLAEGGAGAADAAQTFYTGTAVTSKAFTVLAVLSFESGLATAGTWAAAPTRVQIYGPSVPLPGQTVQVTREQTGAVATGTTTIPTDDTIPQNTEGDQYMSRAITPTSTANILAIDFCGEFAHSAGGQMTAPLFQDSTANALAVGQMVTAVATAICQAKTNHRMVAATTSSTTFKIRAGSATAGTTTFNGTGGGRLYGGTFASYLEITEISA